VKGTGYSPYSPVSTSLPLRAAPRAITFKLDSAAWWCFVTCGLQLGPQYWVWFLAIKG